MGCAGKVLFGPNSALVGGRNVHILPVFCHRTASDLYAFGLQTRRDLFVGEGMRRILFHNHFLDSFFHHEQRSGTANRSLYRL